MADAASAGLVNLEKELSCSICTEILYQPLTLLDCLHTFCGSCLKLWFAWQAEQAAGKRGNPYTCPSCRAAVQRTRPDAKINTLLDLYLQANPSRGKSQEERDDIRTKFTPGEDVVPRLSSRRAHARSSNSGSDSEADRRMVDEARARSLRDLDDAATSRTAAARYERGVRHEARTRGAEATPRVPAGRNVEHQSSLRSLISSSDVDADGIEEEILRQIIEEGLLDGIEHITPAQEDELSERIAEAYRRRHQGGARARSNDNRRSLTSERPANRPPERSSERPGGREAERRSSDHAPRDRAPANSQQAARSRTRQHARSASATDTPPVAVDQASRPPVSRPHLLEAYPTNSNTRRRTASESRGQTRRSTAPVSGSPNVASQAARSATDLSSQSRTSESEDRPLPQVAVGPRRSTESRVEQIGRSGRSPSGRSTQQPPPTVRNNSTLSLPTQDRPKEERGSRERSPRIDFSSDPEVVPGVQSPTAISSPAEIRPHLYREPSIICQNCGKRNIQYQNHVYCSICYDGQYSLCQDCYRGEKGCLEWLGFGHLALRRLEKQGGSTTGPPHALIGRQYKQPRPDTVQSVHSSGGDERRILTTDDPHNRLRTGAFCFSCRTYANSCFWQCDICNAGELGFCTSCVIKGRCCTHALLPLAHVATSRTELMSNTTSTIVDISLNPQSPHTIQKFPPASTSASCDYTPLMLTIRCTICHTNIPPEDSRYHCNKCDQGDYDMCEHCYKNMGESGQISRQDGADGWRRCLLGHRMTVYRFEETRRGQERIITRHLVGGLFLEDHRSGDAPSNAQVEWFEGAERKTKMISQSLSEQGNGVSMVSSTPLPPDGGVGMIFRARWSWVATDDGAENLSFPRNAEIREVTEISRDWYAGAYAGKKGVFPSAYVIKVGIVTSND